MKSIIKVLSIITTLTMTLGMFVGCSKKPPEPADLFLNAFALYRDELQKEPFIEFLSKISDTPSLNIVLENNEGDEKVKADITTYFDAKDAVSAVANLEYGGQKIDAQMLLSAQKVVVGTSLLEDAYGIDLTKFKENFKTSVFGTQGENLAGMDEEEENELLKQFDELFKSLEGKENDIDVAKVAKDAFRAKATFTMDDKTPAMVAGKEVKDNTTVTATLTKTQLKSMVNEIVDKAGLQSNIDDMIKHINDNYVSYTPDVMSDENNTNNAPKLENMNDIIDYVLDDMSDKSYDDDDIIIAVKLILDAKYNAIMVAEITVCDDTIKIDCGEDPKNITHIAITYPDEVLPLGSAAPITQNATIDVYIETGTTGTVYKLTDENMDGIQIAINKAQRTVTFYVLTNGKIDETQTKECKYDLTDNALSLQTTIEDSINLAVTLKKNDTSPVKYDDYKEILKLSKDEIQSLVEQLDTLFNVMPDVPNDDDDIIIEPDEDDIFIEHVPFNEDVFSIE